MKIKYNINTTEGIRRMFEEHTEFAEYVASFARTQKITIDEALTHAIVRARAEDYINRSF